MSSEFPNTTTRGFSAAAEPGVAVCLLPGTELAFSEEAVCNHPFATLFPGMRFGSIGARLARFRKINRRVADAHHDALEFANGKIVLLTSLRVGQTATVLQLPASDNADRKASESRQGSKQHRRASGPQSSEQLIGDSWRLRKERTSLTMAAAAADEKMSGR